MGTPIPSYPVTGGEGGSGIIARMRVQKAVWWQRGAPDGEGGFAYDYAVEVECRWQDVQVEFIDSNGNRLISSSVVFPDRAMSVGDMMALIELDDLDSGLLTDPMSCSTSQEIKQFGKIPNIRNTQTLYKAFMI